MYWGQEWVRGNCSFLAGCQERASESMTQLRRSLALPFGEIGNSMIQGGASRLEVGYIHFITR